MMNMQEEMDPAFTRSVISHMNEDHADACLCMVKAFSDQTTATHARLHDLNKSSLFFTVRTQATQDADQLPASVDVRIDFAVPLSSELQVRGALVDMASQARKILST